MQVPDIENTSPREPLPLPYRFEGLTVMGVSPTRLTRVANPDIPLTYEFARGLQTKNLVKRFTESRTAIALVGLGLRPAAHTVRAHVRASIISAGLVQWVASLNGTPLQVTLTPTPAPRFDTNCDMCNGTNPNCEACDGTGELVEVELPDTAYKYVQALDDYPTQTSTSPEHAAAVQLAADKWAKRWMTEGNTGGKSLLNDPEIEL